MKRIFTGYSTALLCGIAMAFLSASVSADGVMAQVFWGIQPFDNNSRDAAILSDASGEPIAVSDFNAEYSLVLAFVGEGEDAEGYDPAVGFETLEWIGEAQATSAKARFPDVDMDGDLYVERTASLPVDWLDDTDFEWEDVYFVSLVRSKTTQRVWRLSEVSGGTDYATMGQFDAVGSDPGKMVLYPDMNKLDLYPETDSGVLYIGAEIPQRCVWMADKGLAAADLAGYGEETVALAMALDKVPAEVAGGVELKIGSISLDPQAGSATLAFQFTATDETGESAAVSSLRGGARLLLETASSAGDLGTENASKQEVSLSSASLTIPTSGDTLFARLVLDTP